MWPNPQYPAGVVVSLPNLLHFALLTKHSINSVVFFLAQWACCLLWMNKISCFLIRAIYAISCTDIIWYYASFLTKFPVGTFHLQFMQTPLFKPSFPSRNSTLPFLFQARQQVEDHKILTEPGPEDWSHLAHSWTGLNYMCKVKQETLGDR